MFDANADAKGEFRRIEILTGPGRRRKWSSEAKAQVIAETLLPGARVSEVARRWQLCQLCPQQVFTWRRAAQLDGTSGAAAVTGAEAPRFVPIVTESAPPLAAPRRGSPSSVIEVKLAGAVVRVEPGMNDAARLTAVLRAIRVSASDR